MNIYVKVKQLGKKNASIERQSLAISSDIATLRELVTAIVKEQVKTYNKKSIDPDMVDYLLSEEIKTKGRLGRISFGRRYNEKKAKMDDAIENALLSFEDGLYRVFINDNEIESLDDDIVLKDEDELTFIRLVMLAGRLW